MIGSKTSAVCQGDGNMNKGYISEAKFGITLTILLASTAATAATETPVDQLPVSPQQISAITTSPDAPIQVIVSRKDQRLRVFKGTEEIATSKVSTGKKGHTTPTGIFSILEKRKRHFSNLYNSAPMPYMQRLTWSGIALHESNSVPNYPASHGCVRLPNGFAQKLFSLTERGAHVLITNRDTAPQFIDHDFLFQPAEIAAADQISALGASLGEPAKGLGKISLLSDRPALDPAHALAKRLNQFNEVRNSEKPLRIFITRQARGNLVKEIQTLLNDLGYDAGAADGLAGKATMGAVKRFLAAKNGSIEGRAMPSRPRIDQALLQQLYDAAGKGEVPTGHLFVRHNFKPLFDAPIKIRDADKPLGAHLLTANAAGADNLHWLAVNLGDKFTQDIQDRLGLEQADEDLGLVSSDGVLDRIIIPDGVRTQINHLVKNGASITISDRGFSRETTPQGTDFIVLTKPTVPTASEIAARKAAKAKELAKRKKAAQKKRAAQAKKKQVAQTKKKERVRLFRIFRRDANSQLVSVSR